MKYSSLFAVKDIEASKRFYGQVFGLKVVVDYGKCITFDCGLVLQQDFDWLTGIPKEQMKTRENNCYLFFEVDDFDGFVQKLDEVQGIEMQQPVKEYDWGQRALRFYDPDEHLIEVGENMKFVAQRFLNQGMSMQQVAERMDVQVSDVEMMLE